MADILRTPDAGTLFWTGQGVVAARGTTRVTQVSFEALDTQADPEARATSIVLEALWEIPPPGAEVTQITLEGLDSPPDPVARVTQLILEYIAPFADSGVTPATPITPLPTSLRTIRRLRQAPHLSDEQRWLHYARLQLDLEAGKGLTTGQGEDPQLMLQWSDDGGRTWSNEHWVSAGRLGQYKWRALWRRLGRSRNRVYRIVQSDPTKVAWIQAFMDVDRGLH